VAEGEMALDALTGWAKDTELIMWIGIVVAYVMFAHKSPLN